MKRILTFILCFVLLLSAVGCGTNAPQGGDVVTFVTEEVKAKLDTIVQEKSYQGVVYLTHNGKVVYTNVSGTNDMGTLLTIDSPMYLCSVSKQFCAAAILMLRDQGKLSLDDTLEKYFPEYTTGKDITLKNLLSMRSGIIREYTAVLENPEEYTDKTAEEINGEMIQYIFSKPLMYSPGTQLEYSNINYILLSYVVEQVSDQPYEELIWQNIFEPLGMIHSGFLNDVPNHPEWGLSYDNLYPGSTLGDQAQGCGDIITTAADLNIWINALKSGEVVRMESFREMTTNHSPGSVLRYGYGLSGASRDGWGHSGNNMGYSSYMYFSEKYDVTLFLVTNQTSINNPGLSKMTGSAILSVLHQTLEA